jgi:hypothetical protein
MINASIVQTSAARSRLATASLGAAVLGAAALALAPQATAAIDPSASAVLAGGVKPAMQSTLKKQVPGLVITKVTCFVPRTSAAIAGKCTAKFKVAKNSLLGVYQVTAKLDNRMRVTWSTTSLACTDSRTHQRASCSSESSTGNGLISPRDAETQLLTNGFEYRTEKLKAKSAVCTGLKSHKWKRGQFDDAFAQVSCDVKTADGSGYRLVLVMVNAQGYRLTNVTKGS